MCSFVKRAQYVISGSNYDGIVGIKMIKQKFIDIGTKEVTEERLKAVNYQTAATCVSGK